MGLGKRRAVGATLAAAVLFGSLLVSNLLIVAIQQQRAQLASVAERETALADQGVVLSGSALLQILDGVQSGLTGSTLPCNDATGYLATLVRGEDVLVSSGNGSASASAVLSDGSEVADNESSIRPFAGSFPGGLNLLATVRVQEGSQGQPVSYAKDETHRLNLPVDLEGELTLCQASAGAVGDALVGLGPDACNSSALARTLSALDASLSSEAAGEGLRFELYYSEVQVPLCGVGYFVRVSQPDAFGPLGDFTLAAGESGAFFL